MSKYNINPLDKPSRSRNPSRTSKSVSFFQPAMNPPESEPESDTVLMFPRCTHCVACTKCQSIYQKHLESEINVEDKKGEASKNPNSVILDEKQNDSSDSINFLPCSDPFLEITKVESPFTKVTHSTPFRSADTLAVDTKYFENEFKQKRVTSSRYSYGSRSMSTRQGGSTNRSRKQPFR